MSKIAYLVFAYKNPVLLEKAIKTLSTEHCAFFVHIDQKVDIRQFCRIRGKNIVFTDKRVMVYWGEFSGVEAILLLMRQALDKPQHYDYFVLLSGSEYPLRSSRYIHAFLEQNNDSEFISLTKMPSPGKPVSRISTVRIESTRPVSRLAWKILARLGLAERDYREQLGGLEPYSGITWWALSRRACEYVLRFTESNPQVEKFFRNTFSPEESFIHTVLGNSPFRQRVRGNVLFEDWTPPGGDPRNAVRGQLPQNLSDHHVAFFRAQEKVWLDDLYGRREALFARKFSDKNLDLMDQLDQMILQKDGATSGSADDPRACSSSVCGSGPHR
jgi:hypothetical protein